MNGVTNSWLITLYNYYFMLRTNFKGTALGLSVNKSDIALAWVYIYLLYYFYHAVLVLLIL